MHPHPTRPFLLLSLSLLPLLVFSSDAPAGGPQTGPGPDAATEQSIAEPDHNCWRSAEP